MLPHPRPLFLYPSSHLLRSHPLSQSLYCPRPRPWDPPQPSPLSTMTLFLLARARVQSCLEPNLARVINHPREGTATMDHRWRWLVGLVPSRPNVPSERIVWRIVQVLFWAWIRMSEWRIIWMWMECAVVCNALRVGVWWLLLVLYGICSTKSEISLQYWNIYIYAYYIYMRVQTSRCKEHSISYQLSSKLFSIVAIIKPREELYRQ